MTKLDASRERRRTTARDAVAFAVATAVSTVGLSAAAADELAIVEVKVDRPTIHALGVQVLTSDDDNTNARITVRYRKKGESTWRVGPALFRVLPETVSAHTVPKQHAGSIFDLLPGTTYEIELHAVDPDGLDEKRIVEATTRAYPKDPKTPRAVSVTNAATLTSALNDAKAGDVITLADGTYAGTFRLNASGTEENPIVLRGASASGVVLDGGGCTGCNVLEVSGSHVHVERMTLKSGTRAIRFFGATTGGSVRHVVIRDVVHGIGSQAGQTDFTICDNDIEGRLKWPWVFEGDATSHWDDRGVDVNGEGHVVCHNRIVGFGDPIVNKTRGVRSWDVHGNDVYDSFDGTELDESEGNARLYRNRWTNVMAPISIQPSLGGPVYALRNVILNCADEPIKLKSLGGTEEPSGAIVLHNTFVSSKMALNLQTPITQHNFVVSNNVFVGPKTLPGERTVDWTARNNGGTFDYDGFFPDGKVLLGIEVGGSAVVYPDVAAMKAAGVVEKNGVLLAEPIFASGIVGPADARASFAPASVALAPGSNAIDAAQPIDGINDGWMGSGPDLGAVESGCEEPKYGPRPEGDDTVWSIRCGIDPKGGGDGGGDDGGADGTQAPGDPSSPSPDPSASGASDASGCGCRAAGASSGRAPLLLSVALGLAAIARARRKRG